MRAEVALLDRAQVFIQVQRVIRTSLHTCSTTDTSVTVDVDVLLTADGLQRFKEECLGRGWLERTAGSRGLRDTVHGVPIDVLVAGDYPGDGKPKPVRFPDPADLPQPAEGTPVLPLPRLLELKIASGTTAPHRLRDLADVVDLIRCNALPAEYGEQLDESVRTKFTELWQMAQGAAED